MKIYISLPITGQDIEVVDATATFAAGVIKHLGHQPVNPLDIGEPQWSYGQYLGADIRTIIEYCDAIILMKGWNKSRGCWLERHCARIYGKIIFTSLDQIPQGAKVSDAPNA